MRRGWGVTQVRDRPALVSARATAGSPLYRVQNVPVRSGEGVDLRVPSGEEFVSALLRPALGGPAKAKGPGAW